MVLILIAVVLFVVGALMALKPYTYWALGHITKPDAAPPDETYLKFIRIFGVVILVIAVLLAGISVWPRISGQEVKVSSGENWELAFTEDAGLAEMVTVSAGRNSMPYEAATDGESIYYLGWEQKDGRQTEQPGIYKIPADEDFEGEAECLASLDPSAGDYENLQYEDGRLTWLQQPKADTPAEEMKGTMVYQLNLDEADAQPQLLCMLTQIVTEFTYYDGNLFLLDGDADGAVLWQWNGEESEKLVNKTVNGKYPLHAEDGWIGAVRKKQDGVIRINLEDGKQMELLTSMKSVQGVWTSETYTLLADAGTRTAVIKNEGRNAVQYVLKNLGEDGRMDMGAGRIWQLTGNVATIYDMQTLTLKEFEFTGRDIESLTVSDDGMAVFCDGQKNVFYVGTTGSAE